MEFSIKTLSPETVKTGCIVLGIHANQDLTPAAKRADQAAKGALRKALADLPGKAGSTVVLRSVPGIAAERVLLVGLGERGEFAENAYRDPLRGACEEVPHRQGQAPRVPLLRRPQVAADLS